MIEKDIIVTDYLSDEEVPKDYNRHYFMHILCYGGIGQFKIQNKEYKISTNDIAIFLPGIPVIDLMHSPDFKAHYLLVSNSFMNKNNPDIGWGIKGYLFSQENPVVPLSEDEVIKCENNFNRLKEKFEDHNHRFRNEMLNLQLQMFVMDMWQIFANKMQQQIIGNEKGSLFERFLLLVKMNCMKHREVDFYSEKLFITSKYLSEVSKNSSGKTASYWIQTFTIQGLIILLRNPNLNFTEIADVYNFSSQSFFSRYVRKGLGVSPSEYRERIGGI